MRFKSRSKMEESRRSSRIILALHAEIPRTWERGKRRCDRGGLEGRWVCFCARGCWCFSEEEAKGQVCVSHFYRWIRTAERSREHIVRLFGAVGFDLPLFSDAKLRERIVYKSQFCKAAELTDDVARCLLVFSLIPPPLSTFFLPLPPPAAQSGLGIVPAPLLPGQLCQKKQEKPSSV